MHDLNDVVTWYKRNCLLLNVGKCLVLHYNGRLQPDPCNNCFVNGVLLSSSHISTDLGLTHADDGHYYEQIATICVKASRCTVLVLPYDFFNVENLTS